MQPNAMDCDTPEALRFLASACERPIEGEWMRKATDEIERLRERPCPHVTGKVTQYCTLQFTLTDAEREAIDTAEASLMRESTDLTAPLLVQKRLGAAAATLRGLLERLSPGATPEPPSTPTECSVPPEWTARPYWVDPPSGHRYGFPRLYDPASDGDMTEWMIANGYPEQLARQGLACTFTAATENAEK